MQITKRVITELKKNPDRAITREFLLSKISGKGVSSENVAKALSVLESEGRIAHKKGSGYRLTGGSDKLTGVFKANRKGQGFVLLPEADVLIPADKTGGAMHGDTVMIKPSRRRGPGGSRSGRVTSIVSRANETLVGRFERRRQFGVVVPVNDKITYEFSISSKSFADADTGDIVEIEVVRWPTQTQMPQARVLRVLGQETTPGMDITMIVMAHNWPMEFSDAALSEAQAAPREVKNEDITGRLDLRDHFTVTIDGLDAKDFDDALSLQTNKNGNVTLGVHIADVSHYVKTGSAIDLDARARTTSVYLPDRVIPMLPAELSTEICSLKPQVDRLAFSVIMTLDPDGNLVDVKIAESVIKSDARLTYEEVDRHLERGFFKDPQLEKLLNSLNMLSKVLEKKRLARGSLNFETTEPKIILDDTGAPLEILIRERTTATQLIEETMILANESVAEFMLAKEAPMIFRVHDRPDPDAVIAISKFVAELGYPIKNIKKAHPRTFQALIDFAHDRPERLLINSLLLRAMSRAIYSPKLVPHFGLAAPHYCHFTSPIRRYPDLLVHRLVKGVLSNSLRTKPLIQLIDELDEIAKYCSVQEREAEAADREAVDAKVAQFMADKIGDTFTATISGVTNFGLFVELENSAEGLVHVRTIGSDYYHFDAERHQLRGERSGKSYRLGQRVNVKLIRVSVRNRQLDFVLVD